MPFSWQGAPSTESYSANAVHFYAGVWCFLGLACLLLNSTQQGNGIHNDFTELESPGRDRPHCAQENSGS